MIENINRKHYLPPDYSGYPSEDDDDEYIYEHIDVTGEDQYNENLLDKIMPNQPYYQSSPWGNRNQVNTVYPWQHQSPYQQQVTQPIQQPAQPKPNKASSIWSQENNMPGRLDNPWKDIDLSGKIKFPRNRDTAIIDLIDGAVESLQSNGRRGLIPRGLYDIRLRFDFWDNLINSGAKYFIIVCPNGLDPNKWKPLYKYIISAMADYMSIPKNNFVLSIPRYDGEDKNVMLLREFEKVWVSLKDRTMMIGTRGGSAYESDSDIKLAGFLGIPYYSIDEFTINYF